MKSIKEKIKSDYPKSNILEEELSRVGYRVGFEKGANYALEEIEKVVQGDLDFHSAFKLRCIKQIVELLKK